MIGTSAPEYIFIRISIFVLQYATPLCLSCCALLGFLYGPQAASFLVTQALIAYSIIDLLYALFVYIPYNRRLKLEAEHPAPLTRDERRALFRRVFSHIPDPERYLRIWFLEADQSEICRENVRDFLLWAFFDRAPGTDSQEDTEELDEYIEDIERLLGYKLPEGRGSANGLRLTLDPIQTRYRTFSWYFIIAIVDWATHLLLLWKGFKFHASVRPHFLSVLPPRLPFGFSQSQSASDTLSYWYRPHAAVGKKPVVFLHGIGVGLWTYAEFLAKINAGCDADNQIGIIAFENLPISFRLTTEPLRKIAFLEEVEKVIVKTHGWSRFTLVSHSYGSVLATHMIKSATLGPLIEANVMIDPVSILLHLPDVAFNFTRRRPRRANEWQLWYFATTDPGVAHTLGRHFFWRENIIWRDELLDMNPSTEQGGEREAEFSVEQQLRGAGEWSRRKRKVAVSIAEKDLIVDTLAVAQYLTAGDEWPQQDSPSRGEPWKQDSGWGKGHMTEDGIEVLWFPGLDHAHVFDAAATQDCLINVVRRYCSG